MRFGILNDDKSIRLTSDVYEWAAWNETGQRHVADEVVWGWRVSTVFLGLDHSFDPFGPPMWFETMTFQTLSHPLAANDGLDWSGDYQWRCSTWDQAVIQHANVKAEIQAFYDRRAS